MKSKGITDIIAIVLLLMITISMVGFAWLWLQRMTAGTMNRSQGQIDTFANATGQVVQIESVNRVTGVVYFRSSGTAPLYNSSMAFYVNGSIWSTCSSWSSGTGMYTPGSVGYCTVSNGISCGTIKITTPSGEDTDNC